MSDQVYPYSGHGPAFAHVEPKGEDHYRWVGLTKREYIAAAIMPAIIAHPRGIEVDGQLANNPKRMAKFAVMCANALMVELENPYGESKAGA